MCSGCGLYGQNADLPECGLVRGQVGTIVEQLDDAYEVEFCDDEGMR
ncbi:MAG: DUF4926 domain-containing protein [Candidatus Competibacteraceae bacterium]|nr:DUF4926 domain-containing protein [Candidatus Competibacteraceae bacterium]